MDNDNTDKGKISLWKKGEPVKYSDRKVIDIQSLVNIFRIIYYICIIGAVLFVAVQYVANQTQPQITGERILDSEKIYVYDGDTIQYQGEWIRFQCVNAPEIANIHKGTQDEKGGQEARDAVIEWMEHSDEIRAHCEGVDKYGRTLCELWNSENVNIGLWEVQNGLAKMYLCGQKEYDTAQKQAQKQKRNMEHNNSITSGCTRHAPLRFASLRVRVNRQPLRGRFASA